MNDIITHKNMNKMSEPRENVTNDIFCQLSTNVIIGMSFMVPFKKWRKMKVILLKIYENFGGLTY